LQRKIIVAFTISAIACCAADAHSEVVPYFGGPDTSKLDLTNSNIARNAFLATLGFYGVENLENRSGRNPTLVFGSTGITAQTGFPEGVQNLATYAVSGSHFLYDSQTTDDWIQFSEPVTAFGSYILQGGDGSSSPPISAPPNRLTFTLQNSALGTSKEVVIQDLGPDWPFLNVIFVGITNTEPFDRISFHESYDYDGLLWDDLIAGQLKQPIPGDFNGDDLVDAADLSVWRENFSSNGMPVNTLGDANGDGVADGADFLVWQRNFTAAAVTAVPEPSALSAAAAVAILGTVSSWTMRRRNPAAT
jgi:hypothetical protein